MSDELNEYVIGHFEEFLVYTRIRAKTEQDALEALYDSDVGYEAEVSEIRRDMWNSADHTQVVRLNGEYAQGYNWMKDGFLDV